MLHNDTVGGEGERGGGREGERGRGQGGGVHGVRNPQADKVDMSGARIRSSTFEIGIDCTNVCERRGGGGVGPQEK